MNLNWNPDNRKVNVNNWNPNNANDNVGQRSVLGCVSFLVHRLYPPSKHFSNLEEVFFKPSISPKVKNFRVFQEAD